MKIVFGISLFAFLFFNCSSKAPEKIVSDSYFGDVRSTAIGSQNETPDDFYLKDEFITKTLDSILNSLDDKVSRAKRIFPKWEMNLYSVTSSKDTICFFLVFDSNKLAYVERYSKCNEGLLLDYHSSNRLHQFFSDYFKINNPEYNF